jgi:hypothetical protein
LCPLPSIVTHPAPNQRPDAGFLQLVQEHLPQTLKRVSVFEDFRDDLAAPFQRVNAPTAAPRWCRIEATRVPDPQLGAAFAAKSLDLEQLSASYMVDAEHFMRACLPDWHWPRLESLALTSRLLCETGSRQTMEDLLYEAGVATLRMPKLRNLALWNGGVGNACAFIYHVDRYYADVTWRGTWNLDLSPRVVDVWERVASELHSLPLRVTKQQVGDVIKSHGDAIHHLALRCQVVLPASLWQIRREHR